MTTTTITVQDLATPRLNAMAARLKRPQPLLEAAGKAVEVRLKRHFAMLQSRGNKRRWPDRYFWDGSANGVSNATSLTEASDTRATVTIASREFAHKLKGGTITPKSAKALAIPLCAEAYAMGGSGTIRAQLPGAFVIQAKKGAYLVTNENPSAGRGQTSRIRLKFWFKLVGSVTQAPQADALPPHADLVATAQEAAEKALPLLLAGEAK